MFGKNKIAMLVAEFLGAMVLTMVVLAVQRSTIGIPYFVAIASGVAYGGLALVFSAASGGHFNPAITVGAWISRKVKTLPAITYVVAQMFGGWAAYGLYTYFVNSSFAPIGGKFTLRLLIVEAVGTFIFGLVWAAVANRRLSAGISGFGYLLGVMVASIASIGLINPAVAVGTRAFAFWGSMGWGTYFAGPMIGAALAFLAYDLIFSGPTVAVASAASTPLSRATVKPVVTSKKPVATKRKASVK